MPYTANITRFIAIDFGMKWMGLAVGNRIIKTITTLPQLRFHRESKTSWQTLLELMNAWDIDAIILGYPTNMDGTKFWMTTQVEVFKKQLEFYQKRPIFFQDERLTTQSAKEELFDQHGYKGLSKKRIDSVSAAILLRAYFLEKHG